jgi:hypothetical protein
VRDLVALVADKDMEHTLAGLLARPLALGIRPIQFDVFVHPEHDPGCALRGVSFLSHFAEQYNHGLLMFDHEGSGKDSNQATELQESLDRDFADSPWGERARTIVLSPELEAWVWSDSPHVDDVAGWKGRRPRLRRWLIAQGWLDGKSIKPARPKEAFQAALRVAGTARSASLYQRLAERVSVQQCTDSSFKEFRSTLQAWFPQRESQAPGTGGESAL